MKKLLLISLLLIPFVNAQFKSIEIIDYDSDTQITVYCIGGYVFIELGAKKGGGALTQLMAGHSKGGTAPVDCEGYKDWLKENKEYYESLK